MFFSLLFLRKMLELVLCTVAIHHLVLSRRIYSIHGFDSSGHVGSGQWEARSLLTNQSPLQRRSPAVLLRLQVKDCLGRLFVTFSPLMTLFVWSAPLKCTSAWQCIHGHVVCVNNLHSLISLFSFWDIFSDSYIDQTFELRLFHVAYCWMGYSLGLF